MNGIQRKMATHSSRLALGLALGLGSQLAAAAGASHWQGFTKLTEHAVAAEANATALQNQLDSVDGWWAYRLPDAAGRGAPCCWQGAFVAGRGRSACQLARPIQAWGWEHGFNTRQTPTMASQGRYLLLKTQAGRVLEALPVAADCPIDGGGVALNWLDGVNAELSLAWLSGRLNNAQPADEGAATRLLWAASLHPDSADLLEQQARRATASNEGLGWVSLQALGEQHDPAARSTLWRLSQELEHPELQAAAWSGLLQVDPKLATPLVKARLRQPWDESAQAILIEALFDATTAEGLGELKALVGTQYPASVRQLVVHQLAESDDPQAQHLVMEIATGVLSP